MFSTLKNALDYIHLGPHEWKVQQYLNNATTDSVLGDLQGALKRKSASVRGLQSIFDSHCIEGPPEQQYWTKESFQNYLQETHPDISSSEDAVQLLWKCFHFYAYHPFPRSASNNDKLDFGAFQRSVTLLATNGTELLGTQDDGDYFWRPDDGFFHKACFRRMLRSIGIQRSTKTDCHSTPIVEDAMDVLAMTQPFKVCTAPSPTNLDPAARRLLGESLQTQYLVNRRDLSTLLSLLVRLRLHKLQWGQGFYFCTFDKADLANEEMANTLVNGLGGDPGQGELGPDQIDQVLYLLPNLYIRFHQLWSALFQPPMQTDDQARPETVATVSGHVLGAISLFSPYRASSNVGSKKDNRPIALEELAQPLQNPQDMTITRLIKAIAQEPHPYIILVTGTDSITAQRTVVGATFPGPLWLETDDGRKSEKKTGISHLLFQLEPQFRLFQWIDSGAPLTDVVNTEDRTISLKTIASSNSDNNSPYWIGHKEGKGPSLHISPAQQSATLASKSDSDGRPVGYSSISTDSDSSWGVTIQPAELRVLKVSGGMIPDSQAGYLPYICAAR